MEGHGNSQTSPIAITKSFHNMPISLNSSYGPIDIYSLLTISFTICFLMPTTITTACGAH
ncbi:hypothetical protein BDV33DRAFT_70097 [Aspergillus novoparasiticus]|uniref:Uncharacterized protein n=1 Tax=Aspergillus novoparasiticus TaxID=986946 RepID=A0A5N6EYH1_9EURO|nr:hypothetical protein BDV33DRAFT_70097 [Aspergillus novoparasiticus]